MKREFWKKGKTIPPFSLSFRPLDPNNHLHAPPRGSPEPEGRNRCSARSVRPPPSWAFAASWPSPCNRRPNRRRPPTPPPPPRVLPGVRPDGVVQPAQPVVAAAGRQAPRRSATFPSTSPCTPSGKWAAVLHAGYGEHEIVVVELRKDQPRIVSRVSLPTRRFTGCASPPTARRCSPAAASSRWSTPSPSTRVCCPTTARSPSPRSPDKFVAGGVAVDAAGRTLFAAGAWGDAVAIVPLDDPSNAAPSPLDKGQLSLCLSARSARATGCSSACGARPASR